MNIIDVIFLLCGIYHLALLIEMAIFGKQSIPYVDEFPPYFSILY